MPSRTAEAADAYLARGWQVVPIPARAKAPVLEAWQHLRLCRADVPAHFRSEQAAGNIGVLLGAPSAGLLDVDLDWRCASVLGAHLLPSTPAIFGRRSKPRSHYLYVVASDDIPKHVQHRAPAAAMRAAGEDKDMIVEVRTSGQQTVFPPSVHEAGEQITWADGALEAPAPAQVNSTALLRAVTRMAAAALLVPHWRAGQRNHLQMALAGGLLRAGWTQEEAAAFIAAIAAAGGDADSRTRDKTRLVTSLTARKVEAGEDVIGWPSVAELVDDEASMRRLGAWLRTQTSGVGTHAEQAEPKTTSGVRNGNGHSSRQEQEEALGDRGVWVKLADVATEQVEWVWPQRIPRAKLTLIGGDPGVGKSFLLLTLLTHVTRGWEWPDGHPCPGPADCILLCGEDGLADTVRPRVDALGGDPARVWPFKGMRMEDGSIRAPCLSSALDIAEIERQITQTGAQLVLVDPINTYLDPKLDTFKGPPVRAITTPLAGLAERTGVAVVLVCHLTKATLQQALYRMPGSVDFVAAARSVLAVGYDPQSEQGRRLLLPVKNNLCAHAAGLGFNIIDGALRWDKDEVSVNAAAMLGGAAANGHANGHGPPLGEGEPRQTKADAATDMLRMMLGNRPHRANDVYAACAKAGISQRTVKSAKALLGVISTKARGDDATWWWSLPKDAAPADLAAAAAAGAAGAPPEPGALKATGAPAQEPAHPCPLAPFESRSDHDLFLSVSLESVHEGAASAQEQEGGKEASVQGGSCSDCGAPIARGYGRCEGCRARAYAEAGIADESEYPF